MIKQNTKVFLPGQGKIIFDQNQAFNKIQLPLISQKIQSTTSETILKTQQIDPSTIQVNARNKKYSSQSFQKSQQGIKLKKCTLNYQEDIRRRFPSLYLGPSQFNSLYLKVLQDISQQPEKKTKNHKTRFKIQKNLVNQQIIKSVVSDFIGEHNNQDYQEMKIIKGWEETAPFLLSQIDFAEKLIKEKQQLRQLYGLEEQSLRKNNLILEQVLLMRMQKRQNIHNRNKQAQEIN